MCRTRHGGCSARQCGVEQVILPNAWLPWGLTSSPGSASADSPNLPLPSPLQMYSRRSTLNRRHKPGLCVQAWRPS